MPSAVAEEFVAADAEAFPDSVYGDGYRCSAELRDGTQLPCVTIRRRGSTVELARRRFDEESKRKGFFRRSPDPYREIISSFVTSGNRVNAYELARVTRSRFAIPLALLKQIQGETVMSWTGFVLEMRDGKRFAFGTSFDFAFFDLPDGYGFDQVTAVFNHSYIDEQGNTRSILENRKQWFETHAKLPLYRDRPSFICFI